MVKLDHCVVVRQACFGEACQGASAKVHDPSLMAAVDRPVCRRLLAAQPYQSKPRRGLSSLPDRMTVRKRGWGSMPGAGAK